MSEIVSNSGMKNKCASYLLQAVSCKRRRGEEEAHIQTRVLIGGGVRQELSNSPLPPKNVTACFAEDGLTVSV